MWRRLEELRTDTDPILHALLPLIDRMDQADSLHAHEILLLSAVSEIFTYGGNTKLLTLMWIRCLTKGGLFEEALYFFKYFLDE